MENQIEIWKDIKESEGIYQISNFGNVRALKWHTGNKIKNLKININHYGYPSVSINKNKKRATKKIHRLIAEAFIPNPENKPQINHINGIKTDNKIENLEWCTQSENQQHAYDIGLRIVSEENKKLFAKRVIEKNSKPLIDLKTGKIYNSIAEAAIFLGISAQYLSAMLLGKKFNKTNLKLIDNTHPIKSYKKL